MSTPEIFNLPMIALVCRRPFPRARRLESTRNREVVMSSQAEGEAVRQRPKEARLPCETPGCSERCSYAYSCHDQRMGRARLLAWPIVALAIFAVIGILL